MNECKILGFAKYTSKESGEDGLRINIAVPNDRNGYLGYVPLKTIYLNYNESLINLLTKAVTENKKLKIDYETRLASQTIKIIGFSELNNKYIKTDLSEVENIFE